MKSFVIRDLIETFCGLVNFPLQHRPKEGGRETDRQTDRQTQRERERDRQAEDEMMMT